MYVAITRKISFCFRKRQTEKQKKEVSNVNSKTRVAIAFRLSEFSPQYEILPSREDAYVSSPHVLIPRVSNIKTDRAKVKSNFRISTFTKRTYQNMETVKQTTSCRKSGTEVVSLPSIPFAAKHSKGSSKDPSKTHTTAKH